jgi:hypothetical protein
VPDLDEFHRRMVEQNVPCIQEPKESSARASRSISIRTG